MTAPATGPGAAPTLDVSIIVVTYNAGELVRACLESVTGANAPSVSHEVIALDNASSPSLVPMLQEVLPPEQVVGVSGNIGFGRACNAGAERARGRYVLLLNPDAIAAPGAVDAIVAAADAEPRCGVLGGRAVDEQGRTDPKSCWGAPSAWSTLCFATGLSTLFHGHRFFDPESLGSWDRTTERDVPVVTGCFLLVPRDVWRTVGGFDPDFFMYAEDADLCSRIRGLGRRVWIEPSAVVTHAWGGSSASSADKSVLLLAGKTTYLRKHFPGVRGTALSRLLLLGVGLRAAGARLRGRRELGWLGAWGRREEWRRGYGTYSPAAPTGR